jgi:hypothetical protein
MGRIVRASHHTLGLKVASFENYKGWRFHELHSHTS